jgi:hypothetical protein
MKQNNEEQEIQWDLEEMKKAYQEAAEADRFLFGDFDYSYVWKDIESNDIY